MGFEKHFKQPHMFTIVMAAVVCLVSKRPPVFWEVEMDGLSCHPLFSCVCMCVCMCVYVCVRECVDVCCMYVCVCAWLFSPGGDTLSDRRARASTSHGQYPGLVKCEFWMAWSPSPVFGFTLFSTPDELLSHGLRER